MEEQKIATYHMLGETSSITLNRAIVIKQLLQTLDPSTTTKKKVNF